MNPDELEAKLLQIEEQATLTLKEYPKGLTKERARMIIALARYVRTELRGAGTEPLELDPERTVERPHPS